MDGSGVELFRAYELFSELSGMSLEDRTRRLESIRHTEPSVYSLVADMLGDDSDDDELIERVRHIAAPAPLPRQDLIGATLGSYHVERLIGEGGFGRVYLAKRRAPYEQTVAIKVLHAGLDTTATLARFEQERQALALMSHPAVARVYDAGSSADGRPYVAMEYVEGLPITRWACESQAPVETRLRVMAEVCDAVQHAHQKGVIHRDLTPNNILVSQDASGQASPKIIDFGIAKAVEEKLSSRTIITHHGSPMGTPPYASPEQLSGSNDIDTRADVYSLGSVLYEIMAGVPPFAHDRIRESSLPAIIEMICREVPPRPSAAATGMYRSRTGSGRVSTRDLDWIVMRCLEKDRARRYDSVSALAADLRRCLNAEPVEAGPPTTTYRLSKFVARHRLPVGMGIGFAVALLIMTVMLTISTIEAGRASAASERQTARMEAAFSLLGSLFRRVDPATAMGEELTATEMLNQVIDGFGVEQTTDPYVDLRVRSLIAPLLTSLGQEDEALRQYDVALDRLRTIGEHELNAIERYSLEAGHLQAQMRYGDLETARRICEIMERIALLPETDDHRVQSAYNVAATMMAWAGDRAAALEYARRSLEFQRRIAAPAEQLAYTHINLMAFGSGPEAMEHGERGLEILLSTLSPRHPHVLISERNLAIQLVQYAESDPEDRDRAAEIIRRATDNAREVFGSRHPETAYFLRIKSDVLGPESDEGLAAVVESMEIYRSIPHLHCDSATTLTAFDMAGRGYFSRGRFAEAFEVFCEGADRASRCPEDRLKLARDMLHGNAGEMALRLLGRDEVSRARLIERLDIAASYFLDAEGIDSGRARKFAGALIEAAEESESAEFDAVAAAWKAFLQEPPPSGESGR
jgi:serine/threonine protein kinase/tetratricopeptide (TPR) repeat protein